MVLEQVQQTLPGQQQEQQEPAQPILVSRLCTTAAPALRHHRLPCSAWRHRRYQRQPLQRLQALLALRTQRLPLLLPPLRKTQQPAQRALRWRLASRPVLTLLLSLQALLLCLPALPLLQPLAQTGQRHQPVPFPETTPRVTQRCRAPPSTR